MSLVRIVIVLWGGLFLALGFIKLPGDGDLYWQRWLGEALLQTHQLPASLGYETFTAQGATWIPQEWLLSLALALAAHSGLSAALLFLVSLVPCGILLSIYFRARGTANPVAIGVVLVFVGIAMLESFGLRAQVLGWAAFAAFLFFLERDDAWQWATIPTVILWANLHASVMIAPAIVIARAIGRLGDGGWKTLRNGRELAILAGTALGTLCTPLGWKLPVFAIAFSHSPIRDFIEEWRRPGAADLSFVAGALPLAIAVVLGGRATLWDDKRRSFPALLTFLMMIFAGRNIPLFAIAAAPLAAIGLELRFPRIRDIGQKVREMEPVAMVAICIAIIYSGIQMAISQRHTPPALPIAAMASLEDGNPHRLLCQNFTWCSLALGHSNLRVFLDGRCDAYPVAVWREYMDVIKTDGTWRDSLRRRDVDAVVATRGGPLAAALAATPGWKPAFEDRAYVVLRRD